MDLCLREEGRHFEHLLQLMIKEDKKYMNNNKKLLFYCNYVNVKFICWNKRKTGEPKPIVYATSFHSE